MFQKAHWAHLLSILLHGIAAGILLNVGVLPERPPQTPLIELLQPEQQLKLSKPKKLKSILRLHGRAQNHKQQPPFTKPNKKPAEIKHTGFYPKTQSPGSWQSHLAKNENEWSDNPVMSTLNGLGLSEYSENHSFFEALAQRLNRHILYPKELWEHRISGSFWIKIRINEKGQLLQVIDASSHSPVLRAYALINIYRCLKTALPRKYWYSKPKELALQLSFQFETTSIDNQKVRQTVGFRKNYFRFHRVARVPDRLREALANYARYIPPILPTPMGPVVNFTQLFHMVNAWSSADPSFKKKNGLIFTKDVLEHKIDRERRQFYPASG